MSEKVLKNGASAVSTLKVLFGGVGRIASHLYRSAADNATSIGFEHDYDKAGNPEYEVRAHQSSYGDEYTYDNLYRLTRSICDDSTPRSPSTSSDTGGDIVNPSGAAESADLRSYPIAVADGHGEGVGGILGRGRLGQAEDALHHDPHLRFVRRPGADRPRATPRLQG